MATPTLPTPCLRCGHHTDTGCTTDGPVEYAAWFLMHKLGLSEDHVRDILRPLIATGAVTMDRDNFLGHPVCPKCAAERDIVVSDIAALPLPCYRFGKEEDWS